MKKNFIIVILIAIVLILGRMLLSNIDKIKEIAKKDYGYYEN